MSIITCPSCRRDYVAQYAALFGGRCPFCQDDASLAPPTVASSLSRTDVQFVLPDSPSLPGYEIISELGRGGMGVVYKARQVGLNRIVALKVILVGAHASEDERFRFRREAETVAHLQHPNILHVYELGEWSIPGVSAKTPYLTMEFCAGGSLSDRLKPGPLAPHLAAGLVETLALAMQHAHERQVIHRDLKPANILFTDRGVPKIADFGMAKKLDEQGLTASGTVMGTPSYMPPEQASGKIRQLGPAADIYALGAILYECLSGRPPFRGETAMDTVMSVVNDPVPPLPESVPDALRAICTRCLKKRAEERYRTAQELADDLRRYLGGRRVSAFMDAPAGGTQAPAASPKGPLLMGLAAVVLLLLMAGGGWLWMHSGEPPKKNGGPDIGKGKGKGKTFRPAFRLPDIDGEWGKFDESSKGVLCVAFAPDGRRVASGGVDGVVRIRDLDDESANVELKGHTGRVVSVVFNKNGERVLSTAEDGSARIWNAMTGQEIESVGKGTASRVWNASAGLFLDDDRVLLGGSNRFVSVWTISKGKITAQWPAKANEAAVNQLVKRPGGEEVLLISTGWKARGRDLRLFDIKKQEEIRAFKPGGADATGDFSPTCCAFSGEGDLIGCGTQYGKVHFWKTVGEFLNTVETHKGQILALAATPKNSAMVAGGEDGKIVMIGLAFREVKKTYTGHQGAVRGAGLFSGWTPRCLVR